MRQTLSGQCPPPGERPTPPVRAARRYETRSTRSIVSSRRRREASGSSRTSRSMSSGRLKAMAAGTVIRAPRARSSRLIPYWRPAVWSSGVRPTASVAFISAYGSISPAAPAGCLLITTKWRAPLVRAEGRSYWPVEAVDGQLVAGPERPQRSDGEVVREAACRRTGVIHVSRQRSRRRDQPFVPAQAVPMRPDPVAVVVVPAAEASAHDEHANAGGKRSPREHTQTLNGRGHNHDAGNSRVRAVAPSRSSTGGARRRLARFRFHSPRRRRQALSRRRRSLGSADSTV